MEDIPITLTIHEKHYQRCVKRESTLENIRNLVKDVLGELPRAWHLEYNNAPVLKWSEVVKMFDEKRSERLEISFRNGPVPVKVFTEATTEINQPKDFVLARISYGHKIKAKRLPRTLSTNDLIANVSAIFPEIKGKEYHLEYLDGLWVEDGDDWESMQDYIKTADLNNGCINLKLVLNSPAQPPSIVVNNIDEKSVESNVNKEIVPLTEDMKTPSDFIPNIICESLPKAIDEGNYRGGLQEFLMKDPATRGYKLNFDTTRVDPNIVRFGTRGNLKVDNIMSLHAFGTGPSKRASVQNCAKRLLVKLRLIPDSHCPFMNKSTSVNVCDEEKRHICRREDTYSSSNREYDDTVRRKNVQRNYRGIQNHSLRTIGGFQGGTFRRRGYCVGARSISHRDGCYSQMNQIFTRYGMCSREGVWNQIKTLLRQSRGSMDVYEIRRHFPIINEDLPSVSDLNSILYEKMRWGLVQIRGNCHGKPTWSIPVNSISMDIQRAR